jgi:hypothetical protein
MLRMPCDTWMELACAGFGSVPRCRLDELDAAVVALPLAVEAEAGTMRGAVPGRLLLGAGSRGAEVVPDPGAALAGVDPGPTLENAVRMYPNRTSVELHL